jgi:SAM-dependent methyltransferase
MAPYDNVLTFHQTGFAEQFWPQTEDKSRSEAERLVELLGAHTGHILDWRGGWGRIAMPLAELGFEVTLLDFCPRYIERAKAESQARGVNLRTVLADSRQTPSDIQADYAICAGNSIGFLEPREEQIAFCSLRRALKPAGRLLLDCVNLLFVARELPKGTDYTDAEGTRRRATHSLDIRTNVNHSRFEILMSDGTSLCEEIDQTLYTPRDAAELLESAGFRVVEMFGSLDGGRLGAESNRMYVVAESRG